MTIHLPDFLRGSNPDIVEAIEDLLGVEVSVTELSQTVAQLQLDLNAVAAGGSTADFAAMQHDLDQMSIEVSDLQNELANLFVSPPPLQGRIGAGDSDSIQMTTAGIGTPSDPMLIVGTMIPKTILDRLRVLDTPTLALTLTGSGTPEDPAVLSGVVLAVAPPQPSGGDYFRYVQVTASTSWDIVHNLGFHPAVTAVDSAGSQIWPGNVNYLSDNEVVLHFSADVGGEAYLS